MREIMMYEALDGRIFKSKGECEDYEKDHPFLNPNDIEFYSLNGKKIKNPCDSVFIDSNYFVVYSERGFEAYRDYCERLKINAPKKRNTMDFPLHFVYHGSDWMCIEDCIKELYQLMETSFLDEYEENEEDRHNLAGYG